MNNRQEKPPLKCLLGIDPEKTQKCKPSECASCGWEAAEAARRREYVKEHGLTLCADGFRRLIIRKEKDMATRISSADFEEKVLKADKPVLVDFYSDTCIPCKRMAGQRD